ncbi:PQQ-binding-like beta-propeller repeat protein [Saprospiraceae bacterium]|nr:PQQ-binding-like beta-propeller repeat protein [Saprospiraceae bacterium]
MIVFYQFDDKIIWVTGSRHYCIDLNTGETVWRRRLDFSANSRITGLDGYYYFNGPPQGDNVDEKSIMVYRGDVSNGNFIPYLDYDNLAARPDHVIILTTGVIRTKAINKLGVNYLLLDGRDPVLDSVHFSQRHISLYNMDENEWVYDKSPIGIVESNNSGNIDVDDSSVYIAAGRFIESYNLLTGEQVWSKEFPNNFNFSGIIAVGDRVIGNCENQELYIIEASTGRRIWTGDGSGTSSKLIGRELNGVIYISGGGPNTLYAIDINNGNTLWDISATEYEDFNSNWKKDLYVIPGEKDSLGKIVIASSEKIYCFDAVR